MIEDRFTELLTKKLTNDLTAAEMQEFNALIATNELYRSEYEALRSYWKSDDGHSANMIAIFEDIKRRTDIHERENQPVILPRSRYKTWLRIAAAIAGITALTSIYIYLRAGNDKASYADMRKLQTPASAVSKITLKDGTQVTLNAESTLKYPADFDGANREVYLNGEAFFNVAHDRQHPFIVHTSRSNVRVLGTAFNVKAYAEDKVYETTLLRGSIQVTLPGKPADKVMLKPKDKLVLTSATSYYLTKTTNASPTDSTFAETAWMNHKLIFDKQPFEELANSLSRKYGVKVIFNNTALKNQTFTGEFEQENLEQALHSLQIITPFQYKIQNGNLYIY